LYVEENKIGRMLLYQRQRFAAISGFTHNFDLRIVFEQKTDIAARQWLVVND
jgi:hypothetical protein